MQNEKHNKFENYCTTFSDIALCSRDLFFAKRLPDHTDYNVVECGTLCIYCCVKHKN
jgi:hypothetical protein